MKRILLSALLASVLGANDYNYEISGMAGEANSNNRQQLKDHTVYGAEMQFNNLGTFLKPELSVLYGNADYQNALDNTDIFRTALNGVYEFPQSNIITPFIKAGVGYETMSDHRYDNHNGLFGDVGAGVKIALAKQVSLKLEAIDMAKFNDFTWDNNILLLAGLTFAFGEKAQPAAPIVAPVIVAAPQPKPEPLVVVAAPAAPICPVNIDSDKDGVFDPQDKCPNTPEGFKVDGEGCPLKATLHLNFITDGNTVDAAGVAKVKEFAEFMKHSPSYKATIVGHTDSTGSDAHNEKLSQKRAQTVKTLLIDQGIDTSRLSVSGEGEKMPVASNKTKQGRAENRRIEVELCK